MKRTVLRLVAVTAVVSVAAAGCGGDDDGGETAASGASSGSDEGATSSDPGTNSTPGEPTEPAGDDSGAGAEVLSAQNKATGKPVKIGLITEGGSDAIGGQSALTEQGATIAVDYTNEYLGGIAGHPIDLVVCGNEATPAGATDCANQMVEDDVSAVVMPFTGFGSQQVPIITAAGIPYVTGSGSSSEELTTPGAFSLTGGYVGTLGAWAQHAADNGIEKFTHIVIDVPSATSAARELGGLVFKNAGVDYEVIAVAPGTPDMTPQLQSAVSGGASAIGVTGDVTFCTSYLKAYETLAIDLPKYIITPCIDRTTIESLGQVLEGSVLTTSTSDQGPDAEIYAAITAKYGGGDEINPNPNISAGVFSGVTSVMNFVNAVGKLTGEPNAETVLNTLKSAKDVELWGSNGLTFTCDGSAIPIVPNVCTAQYQIGTLGADGIPTDLEPVNSVELFAT